MFSFFRFNFLHSETHPAGFGLGHFSMIDPMECPQPVRWCQSASQEVSPVRASGTARVGIMARFTRDLQIFSARRLADNITLGDRDWTGVRSKLKANSGRVTSAVAILCGAVSLIIAAPVAHGQTPHELTVASSVVALYRVDLEPLAATSCSASACHGGPRPGVAQPSAAGQSAYALWLERDPHARSWQTICGTDSVTMMTRLGILRDGKIANQAGFDNCMACHNSHRSESDRLSRNPSDFRFPRHTEGVGCAGCHGPAEKWVNEHYLASWKPEDAIQRGFVPNDDLLTRARMCASCHVGDHDRDMNHDIIAAGHPALRFEMASHHSRLPKHWRDDQAGDLAGFEAKLWAAGAVASADAWLALQQGRAGGTTAVSTWPEFSANDCSSCHQSLRLNSDRDPLSDPHRRGAAKMARWDVGALQLWARARREQTGDNDRPTAQHVLNQLDAVRTNTEVMTPPDRVAFHRSSSDLRESLPGWFQSQVGGENRRKRMTNGSNQFYNVHSGNQFAAPRLTDLIIGSAGTDHATETWEAAAQLYLLLAASRYEWSRSNGDELQSLAHSIRRGLSLPPQIDSPRYSLASPLGSEMTREQIRQLVEQVLGTLESSSQPLPAPIESAIYSPRPTAIDRRPVSIRDASHVSVR